ncbi:hypothetical protein FQN49_004613 [Arthroderma sp. PD_2]|nr:hypothetical protein FQN49_004613 [Arthroderma sp. PD_2]
MTLAFSRRLELGLSRHADPIITYEEIEALKEEEKLYESVPEWPLSVKSFEDTLKISHENGEVLESFNDKRIQWLPENSYFRYDEIFFAHVLSTGCNCSIYHRSVSRPWEAQQSPQQRHSHPKCHLEDRKQFTSWQHDILPPTLHSIMQELILTIPIMDVTQNNKLWLHSPQFPQQIPISFLLGITMQNWRAMDNHDIRIVRN